MLKRSKLLEMGAILAMVTAAETVWGAPPPPPSSAIIPVTPLGGPVVYLATAIGVAAYGVWKSRK
ncbi:hypothetical protein GMSM_19160 [Geomonas sp. Red276]